jgi:hypothetical protein
MQRKSISCLISVFVAIGLGGCSAQQTSVLSDSPFQPPGIQPMGRVLGATPASQNTGNSFGTVNNPWTLRCVPGGISINALLSSMRTEESSSNANSYLEVGYDWKPDTSGVFYGVSVGVLQEEEYSKWITDQALYNRLRSRARKIKGANDYFASGYLQQGSDTRDAQGNSVTVLTTEGVGVKLINDNRFYRGANKLLGQQPVPPFDIYNQSHQELVGLGELYIDKGLMRNVYWAVVHYNGSGSHATQYAQNVLSRVITQEQINCLKDHGH